ncbi:MAG: CDP-alcohol phosphatidyltransferase family protein [Geminicoccaceae bacterium]|nr:CDP-alcohol phosphatidyltransferase family protein [Geminicoccaceae bacterium]
MLDPWMRRLIDAPLEGMARQLHKRRIAADTITWAGFALGLGSMIAVAFGAFGIALGLMLAGRLADGLDGAIARIQGATDLGGYLDITLDFIFYSGLVFAFALYDPSSNGLAASFLIFSFIGTGTSFLAFAIMAARRQLSTDRRGHKSIYYLGGLTEGTETIGFLVALCLWPGAFPWLAWTFGGLCWVTTASRIAMAFDQLHERK